MTSLARQLRNLAVPHIQAIYGDDTKKTSLLYNSKDAALLEKSTFYEIGLNGLEELETIDPMFEEYGALLFSESSLQFERSVQTKEINKKLDESLQKFMLRLSPYILLKPALKALEWLVQRYHIHFYNVNELMMCVLPYHEDKIFARVLQIIQLDSPGSQWLWLKPLQKSGLCLPRSTLINHCRSNPGFLSYIFNMVSQFVKVYSSGETNQQSLRVLFAFYTQVTSGLLDSTTVTETLISALTPQLTMGLKSSLSDYQASSYFILSLLMCKVQMTQLVLKPLMQITIKYASSDLFRESLSCILLMFQTQESALLTKRAFRSLIRHDDLVETLRALGKEFELDILLKPFLEKLVSTLIKQFQSKGTASDSSTRQGDHGTPPHPAHLLSRILLHVSMKESTVQSVARNLIDLYVKQASRLMKDSADEEINFLNTCVEQSMRVLEARHSQTLDLTVEKYLKENEVAEERKLVQNLLNLSMSSVQHKLLPEIGASLCLTLNHPLFSIRRQAVQFMMQATFEIEDCKFVERAVLARLKDDSALVVKAVLEVGEKLWKLVEPEALIDALLLLLSCRENSPKWTKIKKMAVGVLCNCAASLENQIVDILLPYLFLASKNDLSLFEAIRLSPLSEKNTFLNDFFSSEHLKNGMSYSLVQSKNSNKILAHRIFKYLFAEQEQKLFKVEKILQSLPKDSPRMPACQCMVVLIIQEVLKGSGMEDVETFDLCLLQLDLIKQLQKSKGAVGKKTAAVKDFQVEGQKTYCVSVLQFLVQNLKIPEQLLLCKTFWNYKNGNQLEQSCILFLTGLFDLLVPYCLPGCGKRDADFEGVMEGFCQALMKHGVFDKFLCFVWTLHAQECPEGVDSRGLQIRAMRTGYNQLARMPQEQTAPLLQSPHTMLISLLVAMTSHQQVVREQALTCLDKLNQRCDKNKTLFLFLSQIVSYSNEIESDANQLSQVIAAMYNEPSEPVDTCPAKKRRTSTTETSLKKIVAVMVVGDTPPYIINSMLRVLKDVNDLKTFQQLLPLLQRFLMGPNRDLLDAVQVEIVQQLLNRFTVDVARTLHTGSLALDLLCRAIQVPGTIQETAALQVTNTFYNSLPKSEAQQKLLSQLCNVCVTSTTAAWPKLMRKILKRIHFNASHLVERLNVVNTSYLSSVKSAKRLQRESDGQVESAFDQPNWQQTAFLLEVLHNKKELINPIVLLPVYFQLLSRVLALEEHNSGEYLKQLILVNIYKILQQLIKEPENQAKLESQNLNLDLIVQCIRSSNSPQTHHQGLLLLTITAKINPEHLLHNVMSVFTFMGANELRQDDSYTFSVIHQILETVVPVLLTTCKQQSEEGIEVYGVTTMMLRVFVDAFPHIPVHRRLMLFTELIKIIAEGEQLWQLLLLLIARYVVEGSSKTAISDESKGTDSLPVELEFCLNLCAQFSPVQQLVAIKNALEFVMELPKEKAEGDVVLKEKFTVEPLMLKKAVTQVFDVDYHTAKQLQHFKYSVLNFFVLLCGMPEFIAQVANFTESTLIVYYQELLGVVLQYLGQVTMTTKLTQDKPGARFWKVLLHRVSDLLDKVINLLPNHLFFEVVSVLMHHELTNVQRKALELFNSKLQQQTDKMSPVMVALFLPVVPQLSDIVRKNTTDCSPTEESKDIIGQTALFSLKLLCRHLGAKHPQPFNEVLQLAIKVLNNRMQTPQVAACALLCIAEVSSTLKAYTIQKIPEVMSSLLKLLENEELLLSNELLLLSTMTTVHRVIEHLSNFLSPYLLEILEHICSLSALQEGVELPLQKTPLQFRVKAIRNILASAVPSRVLVPAIISCYDRIVEEKSNCICYLMQLLAEHINRMGKEDLNAHFTQLQNFFLTCLDFRVLYKVRRKELTVIEGETIDTIITMVMKLSEITFKPLLLKLFDWATADSRKKKRILVFYNLADRLAGKLRGLFLLFAGSIFKHIAQMLEENNWEKTDKRFFGKKKKGERLTAQLVAHLMGCLHSCFLYDSEGFLNKERFNSLLHPLVDQIENRLGDESGCEERINQHLVPCIAQFAVAAQDDALWKRLNYQVLLKTRHSSLQVRLSGLNVLDAIHQKLGDNYMNLLPETIPFLAELLEDESEIVEKRCRTLIGSMEKTLGEPLQKYF